jgi:hypothetical protein
MNQYSSNYEDVTTQQVGGYDEEVDSLPAEMREVQNMNQNSAGRAEEVKKQPEANLPPGPNPALADSGAVAGSDPEVVDLRLLGEPPPH